MPVRVYRGAEVAAADGLGIEEASPTAPVAESKGHVAGPLILGVDVLSLLLLSGALPACVPGVVGSFD